MTALRPYTPPLTFHRAIGFERLATGQQTVGPLGRANARGYGFAVGGFARRRLVLQFARSRVRELPAFDAGECASRSILDDIGQGTGRTGGGQSVTRTRDASRAGERSTPGEHSRATPAGESAARIVGSDTLRATGRPGGRPSTPLSPASSHPARLSPSQVGRGFRA